MSNMIIIEKDMPKSCAVCPMNKICLLWEHKENFKDGETFRTGRAKNCMIKGKITEKEMKFLENRKKTDTNVFQKKKKLNSDLDRIIKEITVIKPLLESGTKTMLELEELKQQYKELELEEMEMEEDEYDER